MKVLLRKQKPPDVGKTSRGIFGAIHSRPKGNDMFKMHRSGKKRVIKIRFGRIRITIEVSLPP